MKTTTRKIAGVAGSALMLVGMGTSAALAVTEDSSVETTQNERMNNDTAGGVIEVAQIEGDFSFSQGEITPTAIIAKAMNNASKYLCGSTLVPAEGNAVSDWKIEINGEVANSYIATLDELAENGRMHITMGCSCIDNPSGGTASVNAHVTGATINSIIEMAQPSKTANTIVFTSLDGYQIALPMNYVTQRYSLIVFDINGEELCNSVGGANQLWLGATSARYFARDITSITFETRDTPPPAPGTEEAGDQYANVPNVSISDACEIK